MVQRSDNVSRCTVTGSDFYRAFGVRMHKFHRALMLTFRKSPDFRSRRRGPYSMRICPALISVS